MFSNILEVTLAVWWMKTVCCWTLTQRNKRKPFFLSTAALDGTAMCRKLPSWLTCSLRYTKSGPQEVLHFLVLAWTCDIFHPFQPKAKYAPKSSFFLSGCLIITFCARFCATQRGAKLLRLLSLHRTCLRMLTMFLGLDMRKCWATCAGSRLNRILLLSSLTFSMSSLSSSACGGHQPSHRTESPQKKKRWQSFLSALIGT